MNSATNTRYQLDSYAVIRITGTDAADFLNGQLCNDVRTLDDGQTQLTALNNPKGRVLAILHLSRMHDVYHAILPREITEAVVNDLKRYVFRAKVQIEITDLEAIGRQDETGALSLHVAEDESAVDYKKDPRAWELLCINQGYPEVYVATREQFIAQMLNLDLLHGISFKKGCYTGQEIIARTHNLGRIKRRMTLFETDSQSVVAGDNVKMGDKRVGTVIRSAANSDGSRVLAVIRLEKKNKQLTAGDKNAALKPVDLPYSIKL